MKESQLAFEAQLAELSKALAHPARVRLLQILLQRGRCQCAPLVDELDLAQSTVSQHLKVLRNAGLITGTIDGPSTCYCVDHDMVQRFKSLIEGL